ncbi:MAG: YdiY family protein [Phycisphaerales bacterium]
MSLTMHRSGALAIALLTLSGSALANDRSDALERVEAAQNALEMAQAELAAAQAEAAQYTQATTASRTSNAQPADAAAETQEAAESTLRMAWNEGWEYNFSAGIAGASGNNENFSGRVTLSGERLTEKTETRARASYLYATSDGQRAASRGELGLKNDWLLDGPWRLFAQGLYEYDEFQAWQHRLSGAVGVGYEFINNDKTTLIGRAGLGGSYEAGSNANEEFVPEGLLGLDWSHQLSTNTKLTASTTYYPSFDDFGEFRWNSGAGIEVLIDDETGMTLNAGVEHRHDSEPGMGIRPNDVDYYLGVGWKF